jgi:hypothetical protein
MSNMYVNTGRLFRAYERRGHPINSTEESAHWRQQKALLNTCTVVLESPPVLLEFTEPDTHQRM